MYMNFSRVINHVTCTWQMHALCIFVVTTVHVSFILSPSFSRRDDLVLASAAQWPQIYICSPYLLSRQIVSGTGPSIMDGHIILILHASYVPSQKRAHYGISAHSPRWAQFSVTNMRPYVATLEKGNSNGWFMRTKLQIHVIEVRSITNLPNSRRTKPS